MYSESCMWYIVENASTVTSRACRPACLEAPSTVTLILPSTDCENTFSCGCCLPVSQPEAEGSVRSPFQTLPRAVLALRMSQAQGMIPCTLSPQLQTQFPLAPRSSIAVRDEGSAATAPPQHARCEWHCCGGWMGAPGPLSGSSGSWLPIWWWHTPHADGCSADAPQELNNAKRGWCEQ